MRPAFVLVGGVPGAGKTTLLDRIRTERPDVRTVDPDRIRAGLARCLPPGLPHRRYRYVVHTVNALLTLVLILRGPSSAQEAMVLHDPATRPRRRRLVGRLARWCGWDPALLVIDVAREEALAGQVERGRVLAPGSFDRHWRRWQEQRPAMTGATPQPVDEPWSRVLVVDRAGAGAALAGLLARSRDRTNAYSTSIVG